MKFRKKPVVIEAQQFSANCSPSEPWPAGVDDRNSCLRAGRECHTNGPHVHTLEGEMMVGDGDWIITGIKGERYPCKPDIFAATYEPAE